MTRTRPRRTLLLALLLPLLTACPATWADENPMTRDGDVISGPGTVRWYDFEGGFFAIHGADGVTYDPMNLPAEYEQDELPVRFRARIRDDMVSVHMAGPVVELMEISRT